DAQNPAAKESTAQAKPVLKSPLFPILFHLTNSQSFCQAGGTVGSGQWAVDSGQWAVGSG
ncbi:MAG: hypothetical protein LBD22_02280, partial [Spirochaetaceae bacterium]|nr:hypothetical protein [Spirochaetaceae bacterium]